MPKIKCKVNESIMNFSLLNTFVKISTVFLLSFAITACSMDSGKKKLKIGHGLDRSHPVHLAMEYMAERVAEKSDGRIEITVYPSQQLGTERECLELLQIGSLAMTKVSASVLEGFAPNFKVFSLPYIFRNEEHRFKFFESDLGLEMLKSPQKFWLRGLCYYDAGSRSFYTINKPIRTPADLDGLKIRVQESPTSVKLVNALGASATPISWGELYTALQQGVVDGAENNPPSFYLSRHYEVCNYYSLNEHTAVPDVLLISMVIWDDLSEEEQKWIQEAAIESYHYQKKLWKEATDEALTEVQKAGVEVLYPDKKPFMEKVQPLLNEYKDQSDAWNLIQKIKEIE